MLFSNIAPFVRFAEIIHFESSGNPVYVRDCRIFYILSGEAEIRIGTQVYSLRPHSAFYCCSGSSYTICSTGVDLICVNFDLTQDYRQQETPYSPIALADSPTLPPANSCKIEDQTIVNQFLFWENAITCRELLDTILTEFSARRILYRETAGALLKSLLVQLLRGNIATASPGAKAVEKIIDHIHSNYSQPMANGLFAQLTGYHEYYLNRLFIKYTGSTIRQYILQVRISHSKKLLLNTDLPLSAIAEQTGFNSNTYFSSYFRQVTGVSPTQFRKTNRNAI